MSIIELTGQRFGRLIALKLTKLRSRGSVVWECICDCGNICFVNSNSLRTGHTKSCGCLQRELPVIHGFSSHPLYKVWDGMKQRCYNIKHKGYKYYGAKGIIICKEWKNDAKIFIEWGLSHGYKKRLTIERINGDGNYCPENCKFATYAEQRANQCTCCTQRFFAAQNIITGRQIISNNQSKFARDHHLSLGNISSCLYNKRMRCKDWEFNFIEVDA